ncbi:MAG: hypothetical protein NT098_03255 [Candidatus Parcubacteria bacterium]|nr:hypothetical protein [Candidatus Parcubacteria bacterium]
MIHEYSIPHRGSENKVDKWGNEKNEGKGKRKKQQEKRDDIMCFGRYSTITPQTIH